MFLAKKYDSWSITDHWSIIHVHLSHKYIHSNRTRRLHKKPLRLKLHCLKHCDRDGQLRRQRRKALEELNNATALPVRAARSTEIIEISAIHITICISERACNNIVTLMVIQIAENKLGYWAPLTLFSIKLHYICHIIQ